MAGLGENLRRRRVATSDADNTLYEPLIPLDEDGHAVDRQSEGPATSSSAAGPPWTVGHVDVGAVLHGLAGACAEAFANFYAVLSTCIQQLLPQQDEPPLQLSAQQQQRLAELQDRIGVSYDCDNLEHQAELRRLWALAFPGEPCAGLKCARWKDMGWQNEDPSSDFRGGGLVSLQNLCYLGTQHPDLFASLKDKRNGTRSDWEYPFAAAGVNVTFMLTQILDLRAPGRPPATRSGRHFVALMDESDTAFEELFCAAFERLDREWLDLKASYMEFPQVQQRVREAVERVLGNPVTCMDEVRQMLGP